MSLSRVTYYQYFSTFDRPSKMTTDIRRMKTLLRIEYARKRTAITAFLWSPYRSNAGYGSAILLPALFLFLLAPDIFIGTYPPTVEPAPREIVRNKPLPNTIEQLSVTAEMQPMPQRPHGPMFNPHLLPWSGEEISIGRALTPASAGVSLVASCRNRHRILPRVLRNWAAVAGIDEVILVDWSSDDPPLADIVQETLPDDTRFRVVRVDSEPTWVLSRAYNLAFHVASHEIICRVDCDHALSEDFVTSHPLTNPNTFFAGNWATARNENEAHLNGAAIIRRDAFWGVSGYDERIQTYGWDDEDLYGRLRASGLIRRNINYESIVHIPHGDSSRAQQGVLFVEVEVDYNRLLLDTLQRWTASEVTSMYSVRTNDIGRALGMVSSVQVKSIEDLSSISARRAAWDLALGRRLHDQYGIPWDLLQGIDRPNREGLLEKLKQRHTIPTSMPPVFVAHVMHGLGNRLRAVASAMSFAASTKRQLIIVWEQDTHCAAAFEDLFDVQQSHVVVVRSGPKWPIEENIKYDPAWKGFVVYNYMETEGFGARKGKLVHDDPAKHIYFKSAYVIEAPGHSSWEKDNKMLLSLVPVHQVTSIVEHLTGLHPEKRIGVHIRNRDLEHDIALVNSVKEYGFEAVETMEYWRKKSNYKHFMQKMDEILAQDPSQTFFIASDSVAVLKFLCDRYPGKIASIPRECDDRDGECLKFAMADLLVLGKTKMLLGSNWSSFTEAAQRFGAKNALLAGRDFAVDPAHVE